MAAAEILLDYDGDPPPDFLDRLRFVCDVLDLRVGVVWFRKTKRGHHAGFEAVGRALDAQSVVAVQLIMGSDFKRETFNLVRALNLARVPAFWRTRWNVLYARKLKEASP